MGGKILNNSGGITNMKPFGQRNENARFFLLKHRTKGFYNCFFERFKAIYEFCLS